MGEATLPVAGGAVGSVSAGSATSSTVSTAVFGVSSVVSSVVSTETGASGVTSSGVSFSSLPPQAVNPGSNTSIMTIRYFADNVFMLFLLLL